MFTLNKPLLLVRLKLLPHYYLRLVCFLAVFMVFLQSTQAQDTAGLNKTQKNVLEGAKETLKSDDSTITSILMIVVVIGVVAVALWLSFKSSPGEDKHKKVLDRHRKSGQD